jgi:hypothetical protein
MPRKPTQTFGHIAFSKDGRVKQHLTCLSEDKPTQEFEALQRIIEFFNTSWAGHQVSFVRQLAENDHDFIIEVNGQETDIQLTELVDRSFTFPITEEEYNSGKWRHYIAKASGEIPWAIDPEKKDCALSDVIRKKVSKNYSKSGGRPLWLLVFATFIYETEYVQAGQPKVSPGLQRARDYLCSEDRNVFDAVWFCDLETRPVCVWSR